MKLSKCLLSKTEYFSYLSRRVLHNIYYRITQIQNELVNGTVDQKDDPYEDESNMLVALNSRFIEFNNSMGLEDVLMLDENFSIKDVAQEFFSTATNEDRESNNDKQQKFQLNKLVGLNNSRKLCQDFGVFNLKKLLKDISENGQLVEGVNIPSKESQENKIFCENSKVNLVETKDLESDTNILRYFPSDDYENVRKVMEVNEEQFKKLDNFLEGMDSESLERGEEEEEKREQSEEGKGDEEEEEQGETEEPVEQIEEDDDSPVTKYSVEDLLVKGNNREIVLQTNYNLINGSSDQLLDQLNQAGNNGSKSHFNNFQLTMISKEKIKNSRYCSDLFNKENEETSIIAQVFSNPVNSLFNFFFFASNINPVGNYKWNVKDDEIYYSNEKKKDDKEELEFEDRREQVQYDKSSQKNYSECNGESKYVTKNKCGSKFKVNFYNMKQEMQKSCNTEGFDADKINYYTNKLQTAESKNPGMITKNYYPTFVGKNVQASNSKCHRNLDNMDSQVEYFMKLSSFSIHKFTGNNPMLKTVTSKILRSLIKNKLANIKKNKEMSKQKISEIIKQQNENHCEATFFVKGDTSKNTKLTKKKRRVSVSFNPIRSNKMHCTFEHMLILCNPYLRTIPQQYINVRPLEKFFNLSILRHISHISKREELTDLWKYFSYFVTNKQPADNDSAKQPYVINSKIILQLLKTMQKIKQQPNYLSGKNLNEEVSQNPRCDFKDQSRSEVFLSRIESTSQEIAKLFDINMKQFYKLEKKVTRNLLVNETFLKTLENSGCFFNYNTDRVQLKRKEIDIVHRTSNINVKKIEDLIMLTEKTSDVCNDIQL